MKAITRRHNDLRVATFIKKKKRFWYKFSNAVLCYLVGPGLGFVVFPESIAQMPGASVWAVMFFFMLFTLGLDSQVSGLTLYNHLVGG